MSEYKERMRMSQYAYDNMHPDIKKALEDNPIMEIIING
jgi:hypothetical protein